MANYSSSYEVKQALQIARGNLADARKAKDKAKQDKYLKECTNLQYILDHFPKRK